jgi:hypothetical protein
MAEEAKPYTTPQDFYFCVPLYARLQLDVHQIKNHLMRDLDVDGWCPYCQKTSTFHRDPGTQLTGYNDAYFLTLEQYGAHRLYCARNRQGHGLIFYWLLSAATLQKIGQYPSFADIAVDESKSFSGLLDKTDSAEFHKAIGLAAHGVGIGSYVYLRRIFERLIGERFAAHKDAEGWNEEDFKRLRMAKRIELLKKYLPAFLVRNAKIYSILSLGVHELNEKDCLAFFPILRQSTVWVLEQDRKRQEELDQEKALQRAIADFKPPGSPELDKT